MLKKINDKNPFVESFLFSMSIVFILCMYLGFVKNPIFFIFAVLFEGLAIFMYWNDNGEYVENE